MYAHLGLTPQSVGVLGGYKVQGKSVEAAKQLLEDAKKCEAAGAIAIVFECVPYQVGQLVTESLSIPTIGIGAGSDTDGQVLVYHDILTYGVDRVAKFVKQYGNADQMMREAILNYVSEVKMNDFPTTRTFVYDE